MITIPEAVEILKEALKEDKSDGSYYHHWILSIAKAFQDEYNRELDDEGIRTRSIRLISNSAAKNFIDSFIN